MVPAGGPVPIPALVQFLVIAPQANMDGSLNIFQFMEELDFDEAIALYDFGLAICMF